MEYLNAFLCGGILCAAGQILIDRTHLTPARILTGYVLAGVILGAWGGMTPWPNGAAPGPPCRSPVLAHIWRKAFAPQWRKTAHSARSPADWKRCWRRHRRNSVRFSGRAAVQKR